MNLLFTISHKIFKLFRNLLFYLVISKKKLLVARHPVCEWVREVLMLLCFSFAFDQFFLRFFLEIIGKRTAVSYALFTDVEAQVDF